MDLRDVGELIATRKLILSKDGEHREILVRMGKPQAFKDSSGFYCPIQIIGLGDEKVRFAAGVDAIQALQLALKRTSVELKTLDDEPRGKLRWEGDTDLGF